MKNINTAVIAVAMAAYSISCETPHTMVSDTGTAKQERTSNTKPCLDSLMAEAIQNQQNSGDVTGIILYYRSSFRALQERIQHIATTTFVQHESALGELKQSMEDQSRPYENLTQGLLKWVSGEWAVNLNKKQTQGMKDKILRRASIELPKLEGDALWSPVEFESLNQTQAKNLQPYLRLLSEFNRGIKQSLAEAHPNVRFHEANSCLAYRSIDKTMILIGGATWNHPILGEGYTEFHMFISTVSGELVSERWAYSTWPYEPGEVKQLRETFEMITPLVKAAIRLAAAP